MTRHESIVSSQVTRPLSAYSQAVRAGDYIFISGQGPLDDVAAIVGSGIAEQSEVTLANLSRVLEAAHCSLRDVVRVTVYLSSIGHYAQFNTVYERFFDVPPFPARTCVGAELWNGVLVEIDAIACAAKDS